MTERKMATWWTPTGYERRLEPQRWRDAADSSDDGKHWDQLLAQAGYEPAGGTELDKRSFDMEITCWQAEARDGDPTHMRVEMDDIGYCHGCIWIEDTHFDAWWFEKYPQLLAQQRQMEATQSLIALTKTVIAWVRHGSGEHVIDQLATCDADDRRAAERWQRERDAAARRKREQEQQGQ